MSRRAWSSLRLAGKRAVCRLARTVRRATGVERTVYVEQRTGEYGEYWRSAARLLGAEFVPLTDEIWEVRLGGRRARLASYVAGRDDSVTRRVAGDKLLCHQLAAQSGVPVPDHLRFRLDTLSAAREFAASAPGPYVVKPRRDTASGLGITLGIRSPREVERAAILASLHESEFLIERMVPGESYRLLFLEGELIHAVRRRGIRVRGDGRSPIRTLLRDQWPLPLDLGLLDRRTLELQALALDDVPAEGRSVLVHGVATPGRHRELRTVYDEPVTDLICDALAAEARRVVDAIGSTFAGVDLVTVDPARSLRQSGGACLEVNTTPGIHHHYHTVEDHRSHPVAVAVLRSMLRSAAPHPPRPSDPVGFPVQPPIGARLATL